MALTAYYNDGTASVANGSTTVTGQGTQWKARGFRAGDAFHQDGRVGLVADVVSDTEITLLMPWAGTTQVEQAYALVPAAPGTDVSLATIDLLTYLRGGALAALASAGSAAGKFPYYDGAGTAALATLTAFGRTLLAANDVGEAGLLEKTAQAADSAKLAGVAPTAFIKTLLDDPDKAAALVTLGAQAALGFTPANKAGDTFGGNVLLNDGTISHRVALSTSGVLYTGTFSDHPVVQQINNAKVARWTSAGLDLKAGGLKFPATAIPSADPNTLDDYEEGTWTPTIVGTTTVGSNAYGDQNGIYIKIGSHVLLMGYISITAKGGMTGSFAIVDGIPFVGLNSGTSRWSGLATEMTNITGVSGFGAVQIQQNASFAYIMKNAQAGYVTAADIQNNTQIGFSIAYRTAS